MEARHKQFALGSGVHANKSIARQLLKATLRKARGTELDIHLISSNQQRGSSFGERFANAFEDVFAKGYDKVIAIGNDSPGLTRETLNTAAGLLAGEQPVLGPSSDGGVYLIGLSKAHWDRSAFLDISWETEAVQADLYHSLLPEGLAFEWLTEQADIDGHLDLDAYLRARPHATLSRKIRSILAGAKPPVGTRIHTPLLTLISSVRKLRGPPMA